MVVFPNCKINLGLHVLSKREDGFHNIETVFYPINWCDAIEVIENKETSETFRFSQSGLEIAGRVDQNLLYQVWSKISSNYALPPLQVHLHKHIPMGAGLGGGSSDAAFFIHLLDEKFNLRIPLSEKIKYAKQIGSDCTFFLSNTPVFATGKGDELDQIEIDLGPYFILLVYPNVHSNTKDAYSSLTPKAAKHDLRKVLREYPIQDWKTCLVNDFEQSIFRKYPEIEALKLKLYQSGAVYASMSGSGSTVFGIFEKEPDFVAPKNYQVYLQTPERKIL